MVACQVKLLTNCLSRNGVENFSEQKIAAREELFVQLEVKRDKERTNQIGRVTCKDTSLSSEI